MPSGRRKRDTWKARNQSLNATGDDVINRCRYCPPPANKECQNGSGASEQREWHVRHTCSQRQQSEEGRERADGQ